MVQNFYLLSAISQHLLSPSQVSPDQAGLISNLAVFPILILPVPSLIYMAQDCFCHVARPGILNESSLCYPIVPLAFSLGQSPSGHPPPLQGGHPRGASTPSLALSSPTPTPSPSPPSPLMVITHSASHSLANVKPAEPVLYQIPPPSSPIPSKAPSVGPVPASALPLPTPSFLHRAGNTMPPHTPTPPPSFPSVGRGMEPVPTPAAPLVAAFPLPPPNPVPL